MAAAIPMVEGSHDADALRIRRPDREIDAAPPIDRAGMRAQILVNLVMIAFRKQVAILVAEHGKGRGVRIGEQMELALLGRADLIAKRFLVCHDRGFKQPASIQRQQGI